ncbi:homeobox protein HMX2-like [Scleropages formosus]|uniref:Homeobox protein HMX2-like n=1 Tax=Scleropages formosus TaxID=113540 RepID=A0A0P7VJT1_SCLFO|nr:homeobox protein HMX2-like [Scleropages formosus]
MHIMNATEDSGCKRRSPAPISSFTIQSILGTRSEGARSAVKEGSNGVQPRKRTLSMSSEEECSGGEDSAECFCSESGGSDPCSQHKPINFSCLNSPKGIVLGQDIKERRQHLTEPLHQDYKEEEEEHEDRACGQMSPAPEDRRRDRADKQGHAAKKKTRTVFSRSQWKRQLSAELEAANMAHASAQTLVGMPLVFRDSSLLRVPVPRSIAFPTPLYYPGSSLPALPLYNLYNKIDY